MDRGFACCRYILIFGVIILGISGAVVSIFSGYFIYQLCEYPPLTPENVYGSSITLLGAGIFIFGIGLFAFHFFNFANRDQVITFIVILTIITLIEIGVGIWALIRHEQIDILPFTQLEQKFALATTNEKSTWDHMQSKLHCCGIDGPSDYRAYESIPWSCCNTSNVGNDSDTDVGACVNLFKRGCQHVIINRTKSILLHVFLLALCSVLLQVFFIVCTCYYAKIYKMKMERRALDVTKYSRESSTNDSLVARQLKHPNVTTRS